ncbi:MAG: TonB-dependent receptor [Ignavibacteria bacterium]|nr:TonB-dependent receptor [Ignavibacteria bacterium]
MLIFACAEASAASATIRGRVVSDSDGERNPLMGVTVLLQGSVRGTTTDAKGEFRLTDIATGEYTLVFSMVGFRREVRSGVVVEEGREAVVEVSLISSPVQIDQVVVTASKRPQSLEEVPVSVSVMDAVEIRKRNSLTIDDALRYVPGVNMTGTQVNIRGSSGYSRGAGSRVLMLLDGVPFITGDTGELNFESIPVGQIDRIEVVKGASSALYGSSALGGVINVITREIPERPETDVRIYGGMYGKPSYDQWKWTDKRRFLNGQSVSHAYRSGDLGVAMFLSRQIDDGYRRNDYRLRYNFFTKMRQDISPLTSVTVNFGMLNQSGGQFVYWRNLDSALVPPVTQESDNVKSNRYYVSGLYNTVLSKNLLFTVKGLWYHNDWGYETRSAIGRTESVADGFRLEALSTMMLDEVHTLTLGVEGSFDRVGADIFDDRSLGGAALYGQDELRFSRELSLTVGARFDYQSVGLTEASTQLNPKVALAYNPVAGTTLRASFGRGFRVPSVAEAFITASASNLAAVPNKDLKPERSYSYEVGLSQKIGDFASIDLAGFRTDFDNLIEPGLIVTGQILQIQWRNVTRARVQGVESSIRLGLFDGNLQYNVGYTYVYPEDLTENDLLRYRPRHLLYMNALARMGLLNAGIDFRYISRVDRIDIELVEFGIVPDGDERREILVTDFRLGADFSFTGFPLIATLHLNNAFQYNYAELIGNIMPPRTYVLVLEARL